MSLPPVIAVQGTDSGGKGARLKEGTRLTAGRLAWSRRGICRSALQTSTALCGRLGVVGWCCVSSIGAVLLAGRLRSFCVVLHPGREGGALRFT